MNELLLAWLIHVIDIGPFSFIIEDNLDTQISKIVIVSIIFNKFDASGIMPQINVNSSVNFFNYSPHWTVRYQPIIFTPTKAISQLFLRQIIFYVSIILNKFYMKFN